MGFRDSQRQRLYNFQFAHIENGTEKLSPAACQALVIDCFKAMEIEPLGSTTYPSVVVTPAKKRFSSWYPWKNEIRLAEGWGQHTRPILHEAAHAIRDIVYHSSSFQEREALGWNDGAHGKLFTGIYFALCSKFLPQIDLGKVMGAAKARKVRFDESYATTFEAAKPARVLTPRQVERLASLKRDLAGAEEVLAVMTGVAKAHQGNRVKGLKTKIAKLEGQ